MLRCYGNDRFNQTCQMVRRTEIHSFWGFCSDSVPCVPLSCMKVILEILILIWTYNKRQSKWCPDPPMKTLRTASPHSNQKKEDPYILAAKIKETSFIGLRYLALILSIVFWCFSIVCFYLFSFCKFLILEFLFFSSDDKILYYTLKRKRKKKLNNSIMHAKKAAKLLKEMHGLPWRWPQRNRPCWRHRWRPSRVLGPWRLASTPVAVAGAAAPRIIGTTTGTSRAASMWIIFFDPYISSTKGIPE